MLRSRTRTALGLAAASALLLTGCASGTTAPASDDAEAGDGDVFPVTIEHAYGETTITEKPERVATVAWANHEVPLALGVVPVGMSKATWGDDDGDGVLPWVEDQLEELGAETPVLFDETDGIDFEAVADTQPDVILAAYSGLTQEDYDTLSKIAPVVAYPDLAWGTSYQDMIRLNSAALGLADEGDDLIDELQSEVDAALADYPELADSKLLFSYIDPSDLSQVGFYTSLDTRPGFLTDLGLPLPAVVEEESADTEEFYLTISSEEADRFEDVDVFVTYGEADGAIIDQLQSDPLLSQIPAIANGRIAILESSTPLAASANPSPLSIGWGIDEYFAVLAGALG
ncbi:iron-siderophore ABC transporter substrate-binding protein [Microbacterium allomyrinae]|uniref:Iron-siderophore ABC transporter substrate-binding protein n=1 Tax=Microbacterium allomyrinae TaxID=2830666 RepID=A0A9X1LUP1_9MICO|nr:iron-siderophore ABC transporter substrate-binding protein [Microbacterium allomyrinae]MCC2032003.1 iron-siderophore ABC transporter substrate-binding protein [Microbacterium allomyrinae]